ncbi:methyltransferase domain-containing protein [Patescibacteria group bacterium]
MKTTLVCPDCRILLKRTSKTYFCERCKEIYPVQKDIPILFDKLDIEIYRKSDNTPQAYYRRVAKSFGKDHHVDKPGGKLFVKEIEKKLKPFTKSDKKVLEVGAGTGFITQVINKLNKKAVITDSSLEMLLSNDEAKERSIVCCSMENLPFKEDSFDFVFGNNVLYLVPDKKRAAISLANVLKKGGKLIFSEMNPYLFFWPIMFTLKRRWFEASVYNIFPSQVMSDFKTAGLRLKTVDFYSFTPYFANQKLMKFCKIIEKIVGDNIFLRRLLTIRVMYILEKS